jgi:circadian clock protein KaiB
VARRKAAGRLRLRLYVAANAPNSLLAIANLKGICAMHFDSSYDLEIVDLLEHPDRALADGIVVTPTLLKLSPAPMERMIGNLGDPQTVLLVVGWR